MIETIKAYRQLLQFAYLCNGFTYLKLFLTVS